MDAPALIIGLIVGGLVGAVGGALVVLLAVVRRPAAHEDEAVLRARHETALLQVRGERAEECAALQAELAGHEATVMALRREVEALRLQQRELVATHRRETSEQRERDAAEGRVLQALAPVRQALERVQTQVGDLERERSQQYGAIEQQLLASRVASEQVRTTTESLASALRGSSTRGAWGEAQLRRLVEAAGLINTVDFDLQVSARDETGGRRPDLVVRLPQGRSIAVDAKVPLTRFIEASEIPDTATGAEGARRAQLLREHVKAVRAHIDALAAKGYWTDLDSPEYVVAFLPSESLLSAALAADPALLEYAFGKHVALASPVNLWAVLKTVAHTWNQARLTEDAQRVFTLSETLYARLNTLADRADALRGAIERTVKTYNEFAGTLESRVLVTARQLSRIDETRILAEPAFVEAVPRPLTAPELVASEPDRVVATR